VESNKNRINVEAMFMTNRLVLVFMALMVVTQGVTLYKQRSAVAYPPVPTQRPVVQNAPKGTIVETLGAPSKGNSAAKVVLIEFSDYECPFCAKHAIGAGLELEQRFVQSGKMRWAFLNNPLPIHPHARVFAKAAICAGQQGNQSA
jgi:protein-disulfide isomerase